MYLYLLVTIVAFLYWWSKKTFGKWERYGLSTVPGNPPRALFGSAWDLFSGKLTPMEEARYVYDAFKGHKVGIYYLCREPQFYIRDPEIVKTIMTRDFEYFVDSGFFTPEMSAMDINNFGLISMNGDKWRKARSVVSKALTGKNIKALAMHIDHVAKSAMDELKHLSSNNKIVDIEQLINGYTMDCTTRMCFLFGSQCC